MPENDALSQLAPRLGNIISNAGGYNEMYGIELVPGDER